MASNNTDSLEHGATGKESQVTLGLDVWHLIFAQIDNHKDLRNVCLTSRTWYMLGMPYLYRTISLMPQDMSVFDIIETPGIEMRHYRSLSSMLLKRKNERLRNAVRELEFGGFQDSKVKAKENLLLRIVSGLPNLQRIKIRNRISQKVLRRLVRRKNLSLHLLAEDGKRSFEGDMENVVALAAEVCPSDERNGPNRDILGLQKLLFGCPNLKSFSLGITGGYGGCVVYRHIYDRVDAFQFSGDETFPPLEELSLSGYRLREDEWEHWQELLQWSKLRSLTLGPRWQADFLELAEGYATSLQNLTVEVYTDADERAVCPQLEEFLESFSSLESLTVKGYVVPLTPVSYHPGLKHLCLHSFTRGSSEKPRHAYSVKKLQKLDNICPLLETLELDLNRDGEWPEEFLKTVATGFKSLRRLTFHLELALSDSQYQRGPLGDPEYSRIEPILTGDSAREVGQRFFQWRGSSNLSMLILKTGEPLRRYPQWRPASVSFERRNADTIEVHKPQDPGGVPKVVVRSKHYSAYQ